jgi:hypothetical protein
VIRATLALTALLLAAAAGGARADDVVTLKSGTKMTGVVVAESDEQIELRVGAEIVKVPRRVVESVQRDRNAAPAPAPATAAPAAAAAETKTAPKRLGGADEAAAPAAKPDPALLKTLDGPDAVDAVDAIAKQWPGSAPTLDAALAHRSVAVRRVAVAALGRAEITNVGSRVLAACRDEDASVRLLGVRLVRSRKVGDSESLLIRILQSDTSTPVRLEALRSLEDTGSLACADAVLERMLATTETDVRRRYVRVLRKLTGEQHAADDEEGWRGAVARAKEPKKARAAEQDEPVKVELVEMPAFGDEAPAKAAQPASDGE